MSTTTVSALVADFDRVQNTARQDRNRRQASAHTRTMVAASLSSAARWAIASGLVGLVVSVVVVFA